MHNSALNRNHPPHNLRTPCQTQHNFPLPPAPRAPNHWAVLQLLHVGWKRVLEKAKQGKDGVVEGASVGVVCKDMSHQSWTHPGTTLNIRPPPPPGAPLLAIIDPLSNTAPFPSCPPPPCAPKAPDCCKCVVERVLERRAGVEGGKGWVCWCSVVRYVPPKYNAAATRQTTDNYPLHNRTCWL